MVSRSWIDLVSREPRSIRSCLTRRGSQALRHGWSALGCEDWSLQRRLLVGATGQLPQRSVRRGLRREGRDDFGGPVVPAVDVATPATTRAWTPSTCVTWGTATPTGPTRFTGPSSWHSQTTSDSFEERRSRERRPPAVCRRLRRSTDDGVLLFSQVQIAVFCSLAPPTRHFLRTTREKLVAARHIATDVLEDRHSTASPVPANSSSVGTVPGIAIGDAPSRLRSASSDRLPDRAGVAE